MRAPITAVQTAETAVLAPVFSPASVALSGVPAAVVAGVGFGATFAGGGGDGGAIQNTGYRRWMLFVRSATASASAEESSTTGR